LLYGFSVLKNSVTIHSSFELVHGRKNQQLFDII